jgi:hypothetical protein
MVFKQMVLTLMQVILKLVDFHTCQVGIVDMKDIGVVDSIDVPDMRKEHVFRIYPATSARIQID